MHLKLLYICNSLAQELLSTAWFLKNFNHNSIKIEETPQQSPVQSSPIFSLQKRPTVHRQGTIRWHLHFLLRVSVSLHLQLEGFGVPALVPLLSTLWGLSAKGLPSLSISLCKLLALIAPSEVLQVLPLAWRITSFSFQIHLPLVLFPLKLF